MLTILIMNQIGTCFFGSGQPAMKSCSVGARRFLGRRAIISALMASGLRAGVASALTFNFSFEGFGIPDHLATVTGIVEGLVDNQNSGLTVTITSATNGPIGSVFTDADYISGDGFGVASGQVTGVNIHYDNFNFIAGLRLFLGNQGVFSPEYSDSFLQFFNADLNSLADNTLVFAPSSPGPASVPGPLPIFGAGAAFGWSRRLRRPIKTPV